MSVLLLSRRRWRPPFHGHSADLPAWAHWDAQKAPWSLRITEDVLVIDPADGAVAALPAPRAERLSPLLPPPTLTSSEPGIVTLSTAFHETVADAAAELGLLRRELLAALAERHGLAAVAAGIHPWADSAPGCTLRIAVAVPDPDAATRALDGMRPHLPLLLALAANSPYWRGRFTGFASARTALRALLPHTGMPRAFGSFGGYVEVVEALVHAQAIVAPSAIDWDGSLRPEVGAVELAVMDAQTRVADVVALAALAQCLVRLHAERELVGAPELAELLDENRHAASRKGMRAELIDPGGRFRHRAGHELSLLVDACTPLARELDCRRELASSSRTAAQPGHIRQRNVAATRGLAGVVDELRQEFAARRPVASASVGSTVDRPGSRC